MKHQLYGVEPVKTQVEHKEFGVVEFVILQYAEVRMLELYCNFFDNFFDIKEFGEFEMNADSLYLALLENELIDCIRTEMEAESKKFRYLDCDDSLLADASGDFVS